LEPLLTLTLILTLSFFGFFELSLEFFDALAL
jgi:hypothetical protein